MKRYFSGLLAVLFLVPGLVFAHELDATDTRHMDGIEIELEIGSHCKGRNHLVDIPDAIIF